MLSIPCLLMPWRLKSPGHQQAWYWPNKPEYSISSIRRVKFGFINPYHILIPNHVGDFVWTLRPSLVQSFQIQVELTSFYVSSYLTEVRFKTKGSSLSALVQIMACCRTCIEPLTKTIHMCQHDSLSVFFQKFIQLFCLLLIDLYDRCIRAIFGHKIWL